MKPSLRLTIAAVMLCGMARALYVTGPPPAHTGGFGEDTCTSCHFESPVNDPGGSLRLRGLPKTYAPGEAYELEVVLLRPGLERGGFQLSARSDSGMQAGTLVPEGARIAVDSLNGIQYARHTRDGSLPPEPDSIAWHLTWRAPADSVGPVVFNVAANAANGDDSEFGDFIYLEEFRLAVRR